MRTYDSTLIGYLISLLSSQRLLSIEVINEHVRNILPTLSKPNGERYTDSVQKIVNGALS